jgi:ribosomal protein L40E
MTEAQAVAARPMTDRTCWKCGEETLEETPLAAVALSHAGTEGISPVGRHSICSKCGARSVNASQAVHNKAQNRKARKAIIREANRKLM